MAGLMEMGCTGATSQDFALVALWLNRTFRACSDSTGAFVYGSSMPA
jgi:hypothetical protein